MKLRFPSSFPLLSLVLVFCMSSSAVLGQKQRNAQKAVSSEPTWPVVAHYEMENGLAVWTLESEGYDVATLHLAWDIKPALALESTGTNDGMARCIRAILERDTLGTGMPLEWDIEPKRARISGPLASQETWGPMFMEAIVSPDFEAVWPDVQAAWLSEWSATATTPDAVESRVQASCLFSAQHPYGELDRPNTIESIQWQDLRAYHAAYWRPNNAELIWTAAEVTEAWSEWLGHAWDAWLPREVEASSIIVPGRPNRLELAVIDRDFDEARVSMAHLLRMKPGHEDAAALAILEALLNRPGLAQGMESKFCPDEVMGTFSAAWRGPVSDMASAVESMLAAMQSATETAPTESELDSLKRAVTGGLVEKLADGKQAAETWAIHPFLRMESAAQLDSILNRIEPRDVQRVAINYARPKNLHIIAQGPREPVLGALSHLTDSDHITFYSLDARPLSQYTPAPEGTTVASVIEAHYAACGGAEAFENLKSTMQQGQMTAGGSMVMQFASLDAFGIGHQTTFALEDQIMMEHRIRLTDGISYQMGRPRVMSDEEFQRYAPHLLATPLLHPELLGMEAVLAGMDILGGKPAFAIEWYRDNELVQTHFFDAETSLHIRTTEVRFGPTGPVKLTTAYDGARAFEGLSFPTKIAQLSNNQKMIITVDEVKLNPRIDKAIFAWE